MDELKAILHVVCGVDSMLVQQLLDGLITSGKHAVTYGKLTLLLVL